MQVFLAQARGQQRNGDLLRQAIDLMLRLRIGRGELAEVVIMDNALVNMLEAVAAALEAEGVAYAVTGSVASSVYGEPRMTQDADLIVQADSAQILRVAARLRPRFYAPDDMLREAAGRREFANVVDGLTGLKADLSFAIHVGPAAQALKRRTSQQIGAQGPAFWLVAAEDVILMKLWWRRDTQSGKQWEDALGVARVQGTRLDWKYLFEQARQLGLQDDLTRLRDEAGI